MKQVIVALALLSGHAAAFLPTAPVRRTVKVSGFLDDLMDKLDGGADQDDAWKDEMMREQQAILARAEEDAARIADSAQRSIRAETERARQALRREVAELSVDLAREKLSSSVTSDDQTRLAGDFIDTLKGKTGAANG